MLVECVQVQHLKSPKKLLLLGANQLLLYMIPFTRHLKASKGTRVGDNLVIPRPYLHDLLKFCMHKFHLGVWSTMQHETLKDVLDIVLTEKELEHVRYIGSARSLTHLGFAKNSDTRIYMKDLEMISEEFEPRYMPDNVLVLDAIPYKTAFNPFYSSLYITSFYGDSSDDFLRRSLIPYLSLLANSRGTLWRTVQLNYPNWSRDRLRRDWNGNEHIWDNELVYVHCHPEHRSRFDKYRMRKFRVNPCC